MSLRITTEWFEAKDGVIAMPRDDAEFQDNHCMMLHGYSESKGMFTFVNSWGPQWGDHGHGYLPYGYFDKHGIEAFGTWGLAVKAYRADHEYKGIAEFCYGIACPWPLHVISIVDFAGPVPQEVGWAFMHFGERGTLNVTELFVAPAYRRRGFGRQLLNYAKELAGGKNLRVWVANIDALMLGQNLLDIAFSLGLKALPGNTAWASKELVPKA